MRTLVNSLLLAILALVPHVSKAPTLELPPMEEMICMQRSLFYEARNQGQRGMESVASVVMTRVSHPSYPDTVCDVVKAKHQFAPLVRSDRQPRLHNQAEYDAWVDAGGIAIRAMTGRLETEVDGATHFHTRQVNPSWNRNMEHVATVGSHVFWRML